MEIKKKKIFLTIQGYYGGRDKTNLGIYNEFTCASIQQPFIYSRYMSDPVFDSGETQKNQMWSPFLRYKME